MTKDNTPKDTAWRTQIEEILVKNHLPEKAAGEKLWGEYIDTVLDLEALLLTVQEQTDRESRIDVLLYWADFFEDPSMNAMTPSERLRKEVKKLRSKS